MWGEKRRSRFSPVLDAGARKSIAFRNDGTGARDLRMTWGTSYPPKRNLKVKFLKQFGRLSLVRSARGTTFR